MTAAVAVAARLSVDDAVRLHERASLPELGEMAFARRRELHPDGVVTYVIDRNINYTNVCVTGCSFCAFFRYPHETGGYVLSQAEMDKKIQGTLDLGGTGILIQGGLNPRLGLNYYVDLFSDIRERFPEIHIHGLSAEEIFFIAKISKQSFEEVLSALQAAGLRTLPGGGAEILVDEQRRKVHRSQCTADAWFEIHRTAHRLGLRSTCTQVIGFDEAVEQRVRHLERLRDLQDETGGFTAFITWTYQPTDARGLGGSVTGPNAYLKHLALCRLFLDNVPNLQSSWPTQGEKIGQLALFFGANDMGSTMIEENVVASAGTIYHMSEKRVRELITDAGFMPKKRTHLYERLE
ncbi:MAG: dehypoxanthine futalosine cyclase [Candidatus Lindowbacteria bacterium RIFCSPLOWO2_12_FULL_62_27]|nr:MAG: dehypoxanthine futalosine cyclase [Candidatus Lindowbacteria bacterium RIFCSPLOWO2_12_FULL_62_27]